jgi:hypothetical protein
MSTVYVFGAGASFDAGYPLCSELGGKLLKFMCDSTNPWIRAAGEFFQGMFGESPNMEDMITAIESRIELLKDSRELSEKAERARMANHKGFLTAALREFFGTIHGSQSGSYALFAKSIVRPGDAIVTFNYDDSLDRELFRRGLWNASTGYGFRLGSDEGPSEVILLKLHGSVNWLISLFGGAVHGAFVANPDNLMGETPVMHRADLLFLGYEEFTGRTYESGGAPPCMILPGRTKHFSYDTSFGREFLEFWANLWFQAETAMQSCERIVICGYSLPKADAKARELLFGIDRKTPIEIISGGDTERIALEFRTAGFSSVIESRGKYFSDWIQNHLSEHFEPRFPI